MTRLRTFGLAGVLLAGTVLAPVSGQCQVTTVTTGPMTGGQYTFSVPRGDYYAPHWTGGTQASADVIPYDTNTADPLVPNAMSPRWAGGGPFYTAPAPGSFPVSPGSYMAPHYVPNVSASMTVPAAAVAPARSYLVFFDWDKATLTDRARQIIHEAADNSTRVQYTRIEVNGYTDTSGTPQYNQGLSIRRAQSVQGELVRDGVPQNAINIQGFGETHLLVPTGAGVREPQNRRVEIIIR